MTSGAPGSVAIMHSPVVFCSTHLTRPVLRSRKPSRMFWYLVKALLDFRLSVSLTDRTFRIFLALFY